MRPSSKPGARILRWVYARTRAFAGWIVLVLLILLSSVLNSLPAQTPPAPSSVPAMTNAPAAPAAANPPAAGNSPPTAVVNAKPPPTAAELQRAAIAQQRAAIRKQAENLGLWLMPLDGKSPPETAEPPDCDPLDDNLVNPLIEDAAKQQSLDPKLLRAVIGQESAFRPCAVSAKGAQGLMQLMPETASELGVANPFDPKQNLDGGARFLKQLIDKYKGDLPQALGAYNAGPQTADQSGGVPDLQETREYVGAILAKAGLKPADGSATKAAEPPGKPADPAAKPAEPPAKPADPAAKPGEPPVKPSDIPIKPAGAPAKPADPSANSPTKPGGNM
ncbi:MAG: lytic transglycosylase domain-containing protein [Bryobacteraceae bacterium]